MNGIIKCYQTKEKNNECHPRSLFIICYKHPYQYFNLYWPQHLIPIFDSSLEKFF